MTMFKALVAAKLNVLSGADSSCISELFVLPMPGWQHTRLVVQ